MEIKKKLFFLNIELLIEYFYYKVVKDFKDFFYVYNLMRDC